MEDVATYIARVELFFVANSIKEPKQAATFLSLAGSKIFILVQNLVSPKKPAERGFEEIVKVLKAHYKPKVVVIFERFKFHTRSLQQGESISDFAAGLRFCARTCEFGDSEEEMLRDRFVAGLANASVQRVLLTEVDLTFQKALSIAVARETADFVVREMGGRKEGQLLH